MLNLNLHGSSYYYERLEICLRHRNQWQTQPRLVESRRASQFFLRINCNHGTFREMNVLKKKIYN